MYNFLQTDILQKQCLHINSINKFYDLIVFASLLPRQILTFLIRDPVQSIQKLKHDI